ncbi:MAG: LysR family transcriptional regulator [Oscillospiraceae bacterium]|nr:LysR family transcriptional regulator [Oscillospiraceae bacterium]
MLLAKQLNISTMQMYYFIEVANCENFTLAAKQLYTTPSTLSKAIGSLETELDVRLFVRSNKRLYITEAGRHLYHTWKKYLAGIENSILECRTMSGGVQSGLVIGGLDTHRLSQILFPIIREYNAEYPGVDILVETCPAQEIRKKLISGAFDLVFTVLYDVEQLGSDDFEYQVISKTNHCVCVLEDSPLAQKEEITIADLKDYDFLCITPMNTPSYHKELADICKPAGFTPHVSRYVPSAHSLAFNLTSNRELFICDKYYSNLPKTGVVIRPIQNTRSGVVVAWRRENTKPELIHLIDTLMKYVYRQLENKQP